MGVQTPALLARPCGRPSADTAPPESGCLWSSVDSCVVTEALYSSELQVPYKNGGDETHLADVQKIGGDNAGVRRAIIYCYN